jgi:hypothetical protein
VGDCQGGALHDEYLIALDLQLTALVELGILEADAAELEVSSEDLTVVDSESGVRVAQFVDDLSDADDLVVAVLNRQAQHGARVVASHHVNVMIEALVLLSSGKQDNKQTKRHGGRLMMAHGAEENVPYFVRIGDVERFSTLSHVSDDARAPRNANLLLFLHLLQRRLGTDVKEFGDEATRLGSALSLNLEQGTSIRVG